MGRALPRKTFFRSGRDQLGYFWCAGFCRSRCCLDMRFCARPIAAHVGPLLICSTPSFRRRYSGDLTEDSTFVPVHFRAQVHIESRFATCCFGMCAPNVFDVRQCVPPVQIPLFASGPLQPAIPMVQNQDRLHYDVGSKPRHANSSVARYSISLFFTSGLCRGVHRARRDDMPDDRTAPSTRVGL